ncbi:MAG: TlyA family RNA methyltransferase [Ruminococcaceae bacterium]|nr:TlyA family RNA methyltransferase [Oscillospiraceae bacterium]
MRERLDVILTEKKLADSREKAKAIIMSGIVYVDNQKCDKPGTMIDTTQHVEVRGKTLPYVSRGGLKLEKAQQIFNISFIDKVCMDIGASTGGFTDVMLLGGAKKVYAVDVGYGQLAWKLRNDPHVINLERTNIRHLTKDQVPEMLDFASADVSFISLYHVIPIIHQWLKDGCSAVLLIKPQFEAGREKVGKKGVVRDPIVHIEVINKIIDIATNQGFGFCGLDFSPVKGPEGNIEYLIYLKKNVESTLCASVAEQVVKNAHETLN